MASAFFGSSARVQSGQKETAPLRDQKSASHKQQRQQPVRTLQPAAQTHSPAQALSWRPPATRRFLWDRTPQGPAVILDLAVNHCKLQYTGLLMVRQHGLPGDRRTSGCRTPRYSCHCRPPLGSSCSACTKVQRAPLCCCRAGYVPLPLTEGCKWSCAQVSSKQMLPLCLCLRGRPQSTFLMSIVFQQRRGGCGYEVSYSLAMQVR